MIKVNNKEVEFSEGMTVAEALRLAGEKTDQMTIVMVAGRVISKGDQDITAVADNSRIALLRLISGG